MDIQPKVSVIVPVYNVEKYLKKCVDSILEQTLKEIEIILVDDGSTDNSGFICDEYKANHSNIKVIHKQNEGLGFARNSGLEIAEGKYVGFVDSDDYIACNMYELLIRNAEDYSADASYALDKRFWKDEPDSRIKVNSGKFKVFHGEQMREYVLHRIGTPPNYQDDMLFEPIVCSGIFRLQLIRENGVRFVSEREVISEDIIYDIDFLPLCKTIIHCNAQVYYYRSNPKSLTMTYRQDRYKKNVELLGIMKEKLLKHYSESEMFDSLSRYMVTFTRVCFINEVSHIKNNGYRVCRTNILDICNDDDLSTVLKNYNYRVMPRKYAMLCELTRKKASRILIALVFLQLKIKGKI